MVRIKSRTFYSTGTYINWPCNLTMFIIFLQFMIMSWIALTPICIENVSSQAQLFCQKFGDNFFSWEVLPKLRVPQHDYYWNVEKPNILKEGKNSFDHTDSIPLQRRATFIVKMRRYKWGLIWKKREREQYIRWKVWYKTF